jgi:hypothetical protein
MKKFFHHTTKLFHNRKTITCAKKGSLLSIRLRSLDNNSLLEAQRCLVQAFAEPTTVFYVLLLHLKEAQGQISEDFLRWLRYDFFTFLAQQDLSACVIIPPENRLLRSIVNGWIWNDDHQMTLPFTINFIDNYYQAKAAIQRYLFVYYDITL